MAQESHVLSGLKRLHRKLLGELEHLRKPPNGRVVLIPTMEELQARQNERRQRAAQISTDLMHVEHVILMLEPEWEPHFSKPIRPRRVREGLPPQGFVGSALNILRESPGPLTIAEIVAIMAERYDLDITTVAQRQRIHTAVNNPLMGAYRDALVCHGGKPMRWSLRRD